jgi:hypothetical protein
MKTASDEGFGHMSLGTRNMQIGDMVLTSPLAIGPRIRGLSGHDCNKSLQRNRFAGLF